MKRFLLLLVKEEKALFSSPIAYVLITVFLLIMGYSFTLALFISHAMTLVHLFFQIFVLLLLMVPIITMRRCPTTSPSFPPSAKSAASART